MRARVQEAILIDGQESRAEDRAERPISEAEAASLLLFIEALLRCGGEAIGEQVAGGADGGEQQEGGLGDQTCSLWWRISTDSR